VFGGAGLLRFLLRAAVVCPGLVLRALARVPFDCMLVTCGGYVDILMALVPARVAGAALVFDPLFGLYETVVEDRGLVRRGTLAAWMVAGIERLCYRMADVVLTDTEEHRRYVLGRIGLSPRRVFVVPVGAEDDLFYPRAGPARRDGRRAVEILFYGSMIPLHGADTIIRAASRVRDASSRFTLVGHGQTSDTVETLARDLDCRNVRFVPPVAYHRVPELIAAADICLGIFGTTRKAQDIVPTKVFECLAMAKPVVTGDTPATRRLFRPGEHLVTVPCGDAGALAEALERLARDPPRRQALGRAGRAWYEAHFAKAALARRLQPIEAWIR
jgi:glycosyltransferase involved in cell wall biosynthesis